jgi:hypothetical protein
VAQLRITCPVCKQTLTARRHVAEAWLSCPNCLTQVQNPYPVEQMASSALPPTGEAIQAGPPEGPSPDRCPGCGQPVDAQWRYCPHCNEPLDRRPRQRGPEAAEVDTDIRRDARGTKIGLAIFVPLVLVGVIGFVMVGGLQAAGASPDAGPVLCVMTAVVMAMVAGFIAAMTRSKSTEAKVLYGVFGGLSVVAVIVIGVIVLVFLAIAAACSNCGKMLGH